MQGAERRVPIRRFTSRPAFSGPARHRPAGLSSLGMPSVPVNPCTFEFFLPLRNDPPDTGGSSHACEPPSSSIGQVFGTEPAIFSGDVTLMAGAQLPSAPKPHVMRCLVAQAGLDGLVAHTPQALSLGGSSRPPFAPRRSQRPQLQDEANLGISVTPICPFRIAYLVMLIGSIADKRFPHAPIV